MAEKEKITEADIAQAALAIADLMRIKKVEPQAILVLCVTAMLMTGRQVTLTSHPF